MGRVWQLRDVTTRHRVGPERRADPAETKPEAASRRGARTVLLVDDEDAVREVTGLMLGRLGFEVLAARDGCEALELFRRHSAEVACVLLDLMMPRMDGAATCRELRLLQPDVRVIVISGCSDWLVAERLAGERPTAILAKPFQLDALADSLREVLGAPLP